MEQIDIYSDTIEKMIAVANKQAFVVMTWLGLDPNKKADCPEDKQP